jgi:hypothetical protein
MHLAYASDATNGSLLGGLLAGRRTSEWEASAELLHAAARAARSVTSVTTIDTLFVGEDNEHSRLRRPTAWFLSTP